MQTLCMNQYTLLFLIDEDINNNIELTIAQFVKDNILSLQTDN